MSNVIGFDLDGVVFRPPVPFYGLIKGIDFNFLVRRLRGKDAFRKFFYDGIKVNRQIKRLLENLEEKGYKIVAISGHSADCEAEVSGCLKRNKIFFNDLYLCPNGRSHKRFKLEKIQETNCLFYVEDRLDIVDFLRKKVGGICHILHYHKKHSVIEELNVLLNLR
ncbi:hypothetical protein KJ756_00390 [Patescibacteria group bacterium]|nr:hypothetical protein [Patescibacteria group bacterium]MBU4082337.1 hypothetical protein [Patescibacteria group bacterium]MCG2701044.1 hypothetical protein [Candidatus Parcubacteria bacterium]MCG2809360.1 hypothetical protein [Candidatus Portnoybacteria bacterium]